MGVAGVGVSFIKISAILSNLEVILNICIYAIIYFMFIYIFNKIRKLFTRIT